MEEKGNASGQPKSCPPVLLSQACFSIFSAFSGRSQECERAKWGKAGELERDGSRRYGIRRGLLIEKRLVTGS